MKKLTILALLLSTNAFAQYSQDLDFSTERIRVLWQSCFTTNMNKNPAFHQNIHAIFCDCLIDKGRKMLSGKNKTEIDSSVQSTKFWRDLSNDCVYELGLKAPETIATKYESGDSREATD